MYVLDEITIILGYSKKFQIIFISQIVIIFIINECDEIYQSTFTDEFVPWTVGAIL